LSKQRYPDLLLDGEMRANVALSPQLLRENYGFSPLAEQDANTLVFPNVESGNIAYKVMQEIGGAEVIGPVLMGMRKPVHILQLGASVRDIVNMTGHRGGRRSARRQGAMRPERGLGESARKPGSLPPN